MNYKQFELRLAQLDRAIYSTRTNKYSDTRKSNFHSNLVTLVENIKKSNYKSFSESTLSLHKKIFDILFDWVDFLDSSTLTLMPNEIVNCLQTILEDWLDDYDKYIIVTSINNKLDRYSFVYFEDFSKLKSYIQATYGVDFSHELIQINIPKHLVHDYLANVVLYHELAHFIDKKFNIVKKIKNEPQYQLFDPQRLLQLENHLKEYFADIFAAQYIGKSSNYYLGYIAYNQNDSLTHPATSRRIAMVDEFVDGKTNDTIELFRKAIPLVTNNRQQLKIRYKAISKSDFDQLIPIEVKEEAELHYLFILGWEIWLDENSYHRMQFRNIDKCNRIINNLIEKSISNYFIIKNWHKAHVP